MIQWERDLNLTFQLFDWQDIAYALSKISINTTLIKSKYKKNLVIVFGPYLDHKNAPDYITHLFLAVQMGMGTMSPIWWECPIVTRFWTQIFN